MLSDPVFQNMAAWTSSQVQHWLNTETVAEAAALFERGAELERDRAQLLEALRHAEHRLNSIPHQYAMTNFRQIAAALKLGEK